MVVVAILLVGAEMLVLTLVGTESLGRDLPLTARSERPQWMSRRNSSPTTSDIPGGTGSSARCIPI